MTNQELIETVLAQARQIKLLEQQMRGVREEVRVLLEDGPIRTFPGPVEYSAQHIHPVQPIFVGDAGRRFPHEVWCG